YVSAHPSCSSLPSLHYSFFFTLSRPHPSLHSFPTRRSSDLDFLFQLPNPLLQELPLWFLLGQRQRLLIRRPSLSGPAEKALALRSEEHTSELQSLTNLVCRLLLEKKNKNTTG